MSWFCLRMHAGYRCRHAGVCCRADWEIPVETHVLAAVDASALRDSPAARALMAALDHEVELQVPRGPDRTCLFHRLPRPQGLTPFPDSGPDPVFRGLTPFPDSGPDPVFRGGWCAIHREAGEAALPTACRHFPREIVMTPRGTFVSLSHYCPTAAALLTDPHGLGIVEAHPPLVIGDPIDGLDARDALPPLLRPGMLADFDGYAAWESRCLAILARRELTSGEALDEIEALTERIREWTPSAGPLRDQTGLRCDGGIEARPDRVRRLANDFAPLISQHVPEEAFPVAQYEERWKPLVEGSPPVELVMKNYLGARLFANWIAYQGQGLRTIIEWLRTCHAVIRNEMALRCMDGGRPATVDDAVAAAGRADLLMVHTVDSQAFAQFSVEREQA